DRIGISGGSYGGFVALSALTRRPREFAAGAVAAAPSHLLSYVRRAPASWREVVRRTIGDPVEDRERLEARSPLNHLANLEAPLLVFHGANDARVTRAES